MRGVNKVILIGNLGKDPYLQYIEGDIPVAKFPLATTEMRKEKNGNIISETEWHTVVLWRGLAELAGKNLHKGSLVYIEGRLRTRSWEDKDKNKRFQTEVVAENLVMLDKRKDDVNCASQSSDSEADCDENANDPSWMTYCHSKMALKNWSKLKMILLQFYFVIFETKRTKLMIAELNTILFMSSPSVITTLVILSLVVLVFASVAAGAEVGFFSLKVKDINYLKTKEDTNSRLIISVLEDPELLLSTLRVSKYSLSILVIFLFTFIAASVAPTGTSLLLIYSISAIFSFLILILFVEILPKVYSKQNNVRMATFSAPMVNVMFLSFKGFGQMLVDSDEYKDQKKNKQLLELDNMKELEAVIETSLGHPASKDEVDIFKGVLKFGNVSVKQVMQPRLEVVAIRESSTASKVKQKVLEGGYSRLPVYRNNIDDVVGMIHARDLIPFLDIEDFDWHSLIRPAYYVHQHKMIDDLLTDFRDDRVHFAIVVDEFGGTSGIITLEDVMEEIVGDIKDEFDEDDHNFKKINDNAYIFEGRMLINDMCRIMGIPVSTFAQIRGDSDSVAGLVLEIAGKFTSVNEQVSYGLYDFTVLSVDKLRIEKVKVEYNILDV